MRAPLDSFKVPRSFDQNNVDLVFPFPLSQGFSYLFTIVDRFTRWPEAILLVDVIALSCALALITNWIARFGVPEHIFSDRGMQFTSDLWTAV